MNKIQEGNSSTSLRHIYCSNCGHSAAFFEKRFPKNLAKVLSAMVLLFLGAASALHGQGSVGVKGFASLGGTTTGTSGATVSHTLGMPFSSSMLGVSEGVQQLSLSTCATHC